MPHLKATLTTLDAILPRRGVRLTRVVGVVFAAFAILTASVCAQEMLRSSSPWPPDPPIASSACKGQEVFDLFNPWNTANEQDIADLVVLATKNAAHMTSCMESYPHPKYVLWRAFFEQVAAQGYFYRSDYVNGDRYLKLAQSDLRFVSRYSDLPANFKKVLVGNLKLEQMIERQSEAQSTLLSSNPLRASNTQETPREATVASRSVQRLS